MSHQFFECIPDFVPKESGSIGVTKYVSKQSGMSVYFADMESPVINGYFCLGMNNYNIQMLGISVILIELCGIIAILPQKV